MKRSFSFFLLLFLLAPNCFTQKPITLRDTSIKGSQTFAIIIGISKYKYIRPLSFADKDADLFADFLKSPAGGRLNGENIFELTNEQATSGNFWSKGFQWLKAKQLQRGDRLYIYLAGHGDAIDADQFFFLGYDCNPGSDKDNYLISGAIQLYNLKKKIANETAKGVEVCFIMDACRSNELPGGTAGQNFLNTAVSQKRAGEIMMLAAAAGQESLEDASIGNGHGLFTYYLVDGLTGMADTDGKPDGKVTFSELKNYVDKYVPTIAQQRFKHEQVPYFCCDENSNKIITTVDAVYLQEWLKSKRSGGKSFNGVLVRKSNFADTNLTETYNQFYREIKNNNLTGSNSAETYFLKLDKKFPGNPYTLDARSTLAAECINEAERRLNDYINCQLPGSKNEKASLYLSGERLELAINLLKKDDPDYAQELSKRMFLLKAMGVDQDQGLAYAYACKAMGANPAYINNLLARMHLAGNNTDSALYYADKAVTRAPNWQCALTTLALVRQTIAKHSTNQEPPKKKLPKSSFGFTIGGGINRSIPDYKVSGNTNVLNAASTSAGVIDLGLCYHLPISKQLAVRPSVIFVYGNMDIYFTERNATGGIFRSRLVIKNSTIDLTLPLLLKFNARKCMPYLLFGPSFNYNLNQDASSNSLLPLKQSLFLANAGAGVEFRMRRSGMILAPEFRFATGLTDMREPAANTNYSNALGALKKQAFLIGIYLRK